MPGVWIVESLEQNSNGGLAVTAASYERCNGAGIEGKVESPYYCDIRSRWVGEEDILQLEGAMDTVWLAAYASFNERLTTKRAKNLGGGRESSLLLVEYLPETS